MKNIKSFTTKGFAALMLGFTVLATSCDKNEAEDVTGGFSTDDATMATSSGSSTLLVNSTFEESDALSKWQYEANPGAISRSNTVARAGSYSAKFSINKSDALVSGSYRAEIKTEQVAINAERWYGMSVFLPSTYSKDPIPESIFQWHNVPNFKAGETWSNYKFQNPWRLETNNGRLVFVHQYGNASGGFVGSKSYDLGEYKTNEWIDFVVHYKASYSNGFFELWKNGVKVLNITGTGVYYNDESGPYMKMGIYKWGWSGTGSTVSNRTLYFDQIKIGDERSSYNDVAPVAGAVTPAPTPTPTPTPAPEPAPAPAPAPAPSNVVYAVNAGGSAFKASNGVTYQADKNYSGGSVYSTSQAIANTTDDALYQTERSGGNFSYNVPLANGTYEVTLKFSEIHFTSPSQRVFDIRLEGTEMISDLDLVRVAGTRVAYDVVKTVTVKDGVLNINSVNNIDNAKLSAFHVVAKNVTAPAPAPTPTPTPAPSTNSVVFAVNAGGSAFKASNGITYAADKNFSGGTAYKTTSGIGNTTDDVLYQSERSGGNFGYNIPVANGTYEVTFLFSEFHFTKSYQRVFDMLLEGQEVINNLDIVREAGARNAYKVVKTVTVTDGVLNIKSRNVVDNAKISAFHVVKK